MSTVPKTDNLLTVDAVYRTPGGLRSLIEIDAGRPLQLIHDVAPSAERLGIVHILMELALVTGATASPSSGTRPLRTSWPWISRSSKSRAAPSQTRGGGS
jgi:hypothetical protein